MQSGQIGAHRSDEEGAWGRARGAPRSGARGVPKAHAQATGGGASRAPGGRVREALGAPTTGRTGHTAWALLVGAHERARADAWVFEMGATSGARGALEIKCARALEPGARGEWDASDRAHRVLEAVRVGAPEVGAHGRAGDGACLCTGVGGGGCLRTGVRGGARRHRNWVRVARVLNGGGSLKFSSFDQEFDPL